MIRRHATKAAGDALMEPGSAHREMFALAREIGALRAEMRAFGREIKWAVITAALVQDVLLLGVMSVLVARLGR